VFENRDGSLPFSRWWLVVLSALVMGAAGTYQFVWSSIRPAVSATLGVPETGLGIAFTGFIVAQALVQLPAGRVRDRRGPALPLFVGGVAVTAGYVAVAFASDTVGVTAAYVLGGVGSGIVYSAAISTPVKWFDERRGLATGVVSMAYGGVSGLLIPSVRTGLDSGFRPTLLALGVGAGLACIVAAPILRDPKRGEEPKRAATDADAYGWRETVRTWQFWVLYGVFVAINAAGLMFIGKVVSFAAALNLPPSAGTGAASAIALADSAGIVAVGAVSDRLGGERTITATLAVCALSLAAGVWAGTAGIAAGFVVGIAGAAFFRAPVFAIVPGLIGTYYGTERSAENYAALYTAKIWGGVGGGVVASALIGLTDWTTAFLASAALVGLASVASLFIRPVER